MVSFRLMKSHLDGRKVKKPISRKVLAYTRQDSFNSAGVIVKELNENMADWAFTLTKTISEHPNFDAIKFKQALIASLRFSRKRRGMPLKILEKIFFRAVDMALKDQKK